MTKKITIHGWMIGGVGHSKFFRDKKDAFKEALKYAKRRNVDVMEIALVRVNIDKSESFYQNEIKDILIHPKKSLERIL